MGNIRSLSRMLPIICLGLLLSPCHAEHKKRHIEAHRTTSELLLSVPPFDKKTHTLSQKVEMYNFVLGQAVDEATKSETAFAEGNRLMDAATDVDTNGVHQNDLNFEVGSTEAKSLAMTDRLNAQGSFNEAKDHDTHCVVTLLFAMREWEVLRKETSLFSHYHLGNNLRLAPYIPKELENKGLQGLRTLKPN